MPILWAWFVAAFAAVVGFVAQYITRRTLLVGAAVAVFLGLVAGLSSLLDGVVSGVAESAPSGVFAQGLALLPANTGVCVTAVVTARTAAAVLRVQERVINWFAGG